MNTKERLYVWLNNGTFAEENGCRHPQDIIAAALGCSERTVIRCVQQLEAEGRLRVVRPRRRGACNTYYVACWNPARRSGVLNVLRAVRPRVLEARRAREERQCHLKRTANSSGSANPPAIPSSLPAVNQRCGRARPENGRRRICNGMVAPATILEGHGALAALQAELNEAHQEIAGLQQQLRRAGSAEMALRRELNRVREDEPQAQEVRAVLDHWKRRLGHPKAKCPLTGKRAKVVRLALRSHSLAEVLEAVDGLALVPFVGARGRKQQGEPHERHDDVEHCLGDEQRIMRFRGYLQRARGTTVERRLELWRQACALEAAYLELLLHDVYKLNPPDSLFDVMELA